MTFGWKTVGKWALRAIPVIILVILLAKAYSMGEDSKQAEWTQAQLDHTTAINELRRENAENAAEQRERSQQIADQLTLAEIDHERQLADLRSDFAERLHESERRTVVYQRLSDGGSAERDYLAGHAAELDRSLEEGRFLVGELRSAVVQRERQLELLREQILADRRLMNSAVQSETDTQD